MRFIALTAWLDVRYDARNGGPVAEFSWEGEDEGDQRSGRGRVAPGTAGRLVGHVYIHRGDDSDFVCEPCEFFNGLLIHGARGGLASLVKRQNALEQWLVSLLSRVHRNVAVVALANKLARIVCQKHERTCRPGAGHTLRCFACLTTRSSRAFLPKSWERADRAEDASEENE